MSYVFGDYQPVMGVPVGGMDPYDPINQAIVANEEWTAEQLGKEGVDFALDMHVAHREIINSI